MTDKNKPSFVDVLVKDPNQVPELVVFSGFLGKSSVEDHQRLYLNAALSEYLEIPSEAILHTKAHSEASSPLGVSTVWIKKDAELIHNSAQVQKQKMQFLSGPIAQETGAASDATPMGPTGVQNCTQAPANCGNTAWQGCPK